MRKKRVLSAVAATVLLGLTACSSSGSESDKDVSASASASPAASAQASEAPAQAKAVDLGGRVIKFAAWWDLTPKGETASDKALLAKKAELENKYNMKIEYVNVPFDQYMDKFTTTVLAGEPFADVVQMEYKAALPAILKGQLLQLSEFTQAKSSVNTDQKILIKAQPIAGKEYGFDTPYTTSVGVHYNRDLFKKLGLPDLHEVYKSGQWTWEKFEEIAKLATRDTDNDGKKDAFGFSGWPVTDAKHLATANGAKIADETTGKEGISDPKTVQALEFLNKLYNVDNVVKVKSGNRMDYNESNTFKDGDVAMFMAYEWMLSDVKFDIGVVPIPNGPQGKKEVTYANTAGGAKFIPKGVKDPQIVYQIYEELFNLPPLEQYPSQNYMEERYKHEEDIKMVRENISGKSIAVLDDAYKDFPFGTVVEEIIVKNASVASTVEKYKGPAQAAMDKLGK